MNALRAALAPLNLLLLAVALLGAMVALPLDYDDPYKIVPEVWLASWAFVLAATMSLEGALHGRLPLGAALPGKVGPALWAFWLVATLSCFLGIKPTAHLGYLPTVLAYSGFAVALATWFQLPGHRRFWAQSLLCSVVGLQLLMAVGQKAGWWAAMAAGVPSASFWGGYLRVIAGNGTYIGTVGNINYLGELLVLLLPVVATFAWGLPKGWARLGALALAAATLLMVLVTGARGALLGLLVAYPLSLAVLQGWRALDPRPHLKSQQAKLAAAGVVAFLGVGLAIAGTTFWNKVQQSMSGAGDVDVISRVVNWEVGVKIFLDHPFTGAGLGSFKLLSVPILAGMFPDGIPDAVTMARFYQLHNDPLQALVEMGLLGFVALAFVSSTWVAAVRGADLPAMSRWAPMAGVGALLIAGSFGFPFHIPFTAFVAMVVLALALLPAPVATAQHASTPEPVALAKGEPVVVGSVSPSLPAVGGALGVAAAPPPPAASAAVGWGALASALILAVGFMAFDRVLQPMAQAAQLRFYANQMSESQRPEGADVLYAAATRLDRYKAPGIFQQLKMLTVLGRDDEIIATYEALHRSVEGMGMDSRLIYANALRRKGRVAEAKTAYEDVAHYYAPGGYNRQQAEAQLKRLAQDMAASQAGGAAVVSGGGASNAGASGASGAVAASDASAASSVQP